MSNPGSSDTHADLEFKKIFDEHPSVDPYHCVVVRGLPKNADLKKLKEAFEKYGPIEKMILEDGITFASGKIVYITFCDTNHAAKAISAMDGKHVFGCKIRVHSQRLPPLTKASGETMAKLDNQLAGAAKAKDEAKAGPLAVCPDDQMKKSQKKDTAGGPPSKNKIAE